MTSLKVLDTGLVLASLPDPEFPTPPPPQAFIISLSDHVLDDMIKCVQSGEDLQLSLGNSPALLYGNSSHTLSPLSEPFSPDLFLTKPFESTKRATRVPQTSSLWKKLPGSEAPKKAERAKAKGAPSTSSSGMDSDTENLQNSIAAATASKKQSQVLDRLPPANMKVTGKAKSKLLSSMASYGNGGGKSSPSSPALVAVSSPSTNPVFSASQQVVEKFKEQRSMIVHELAVQDRPYNYLENLWEGKEEDFKPALEKVAQFEPDTQKWALRKNYWRELDVWKYDYDTQDTRQKAIDNAIRQFDKMRLATTEPEWQKLLPREERGKGKILSKLQANIAKASSAAPPPKIKVQKADDAISDADEDVLKKKGGENMSRSSSNPLPPKPKKAADTTAKRLLSTNKKAAPAKAAPSKAKASAPGKNGRVLSAEFVTNSDSDSESSEDKPMASIVAAKPRPMPAAAPAPKPKKPDTSLPPKPKIAVPKPRAKPVERSAERPVERSTERPKERSVEREAVKTVKAHPLPKRPRDETEDSSSSSGAPLSKRAKPKAPIKAPVNLKQRPADVSHVSPRNSSGVSLKSKNTSPAKSSPLASSPPTNASDLEQPAPPKKRKAMESSDSSSVDSARAKSAPKRQRMLSPDLVNKAAKFKTYYEKYEALHWEIAEMQHPPEEKMASLLNMRERLKVLKTEIYRECPPAIAVA
ncbi:com1 regulatory protein [Colletotrichum plurivorum]|uniref:Com1 regulatory protein n=1 Tax=Colletotrichum plurivorum TaxID=2175906 RepID=A0A8H6KVL2_9PEZI|nr:com1 regulatory protein [Colletotrichum plurivorum]